MEEIQLEVQVRNRIGTRKIKAVRREDCVPAVVYGGDKKEPTPIQVDRRTYEGIMRRHKGQNVVFHLNVNEGEKKLRDYAVILKDEQLHPVQDSLLHIDFQRINLKEKIEVEVTLVPKGDAVGVTKDGGTLDQPLHALHVFCLPMNIPESIEVDVSGLNIGDALHVSDIKLPEGVESKHDAEAMVFSVVPPMREEEATEEPEGAEPEVVGKDKKVEGEDK